MSIDFEKIGREAVIAVYGRIPDMWTSLTISACARTEGRYGLTGEFRKPKVGDAYLSRYDGFAFKCTSENETVGDGSTPSERLILEPTEAA